LAASAQVDLGERVEAVVGQHLPQPLGGALAVGADQRPHARRTQLAQVGHDRVEQVDRAVRPLGREVAGRVAAQVAHRVDARGSRRRRPEVRELPARAGLGQRVKLCSST
jgi:hypothetical protein